MSGLVVRPRGELRDAVDLRGLLGRDWPALDADALARVPVHAPLHGDVALGELFAVGGTPGETLTVEGDVRRAEGLAAGLASGTVRVEGHVGREAGSGMRGGRLEVLGNAGDDLGLGMAGGTIVVHGRAGDRAGAGVPGAKKGMTGGELVILGDAGDETGAHLRRGVVAVAGRAGRAAGFAMLAGTVVAHGFGPDAGLLSKRGTLVALGDVTPPPTYRLACTAQPVVLRLLLRHLRDRYGYPATPAQLDGAYRRYSGDFAEIGKGEILQWTP